MEKTPMTRKGYERLTGELKTLKEIERPAVIKAISEAREHGDLSENAEYHSARERQSFIEGRIQELEGSLGRADVIDPGKMTGETIKFSATVEIVDEDTDEEKTYQIVGEAEADLDNGKLNLRSPLARALIGKEAGDQIEVTTPGGSRAYEVLSVKYI
ncbi:MAG: transcription elongation factor GreA [Pseudomonadota bacterium]